MNRASFIQTPQQKAGSALGKTTTSREVLL
jgi:hypothetical protein